jgi:Family of unknown function (DUF6428)
MSCCTNSTKENSTALPHLNVARKTDLPVSLDYGDRQIGAGFHITEAKICAITSLDCGSKNHSWKETVIQLLDIEGPEDERMTVGKFTHILEKAGLDLNNLDSGHVIFEIGKGDEAMQLYSFEGLQIAGENVLIKTQPRLAVCKPSLAKNSAPSSGKCCGSQMNPSNERCCA